MAEFTEFHVWAIGHNVKGHPKAVIQLEEFGCFDLTCALLYAENILKDTSDLLKFDNGEYSLVDFTAGDYFTMQVAEVLLDDVTHKITKIVDIHYKQKLPAPKEETN